MNSVLFALWAALFVMLLPAQSTSEKKYPSENIFATGLLGSHFGIPGLPGAYDYVIIGGGTAGLTIARRLAANTSVTVAVIEAGSFYELTNGNFSEIPADAVYWLDPGATARNQLYDWYQFTTPQKGFEGRSLHYPAGKTLGGGSARNFLWYQRGTVGSYNMWAEQVGDSSYEFDKFLPYFKKSVSFHPPSKHRPSNATPLYQESDFSPSGGPLQVGFPSWTNPLSSWIAKSLSSLGILELPGLTNGTLLGWTYIAETLAPSTQTRSSSETSFLRDALAHTTNLQVYQSTLAKKVLFDSNKRATGVLVNSGGFEYQISAQKEVILSAGAFRSPQMLMVSGVGPREALEQQNIPVLADRKGVGQNMYDHVLFGAAYAVSVTTHSALSTDPAFAAQAVKSYQENRTGILTNQGGDLLGFEKLPTKSISASTKADLNTSFGTDWPDIELLFFDADLISTPPDTRQYASTLAGLVAPFSRGNVTIGSDDASVNPIISPNWLLDPRDQEIAIAGFRRAREVFQTPAIKPVIDGDEVFPGLNVTSDEDILAAIRLSASSLDHAACTCAMGKIDDPNAVVDSKARVIGVEGLRVVDASAFPFLPPGHPQSTVYALAEKIADDVLRGLCV